MTETRPRKQPVASRAPRAPRRPATQHAKLAARAAAHTKTDASKEAPQVVAHKYFTGIGRRKEAIVRVQLIAVPSKPEYSVNGKPFSQYFTFPYHANIALSSLEASGTASRYSVRAEARGGGLHGQAVAMRMGLARALVSADPALRPQLRALGYLTRDARAKERKKPGLKRARRAPQWQKR